jgi:hypothetical protein
MRFQRESIEHTLQPLAESFVNRRPRKAWYSQVMLLALLLLVACGREAPPRAGTAAPTSARPLPTLAPAPLLDTAAAPEQRALGDPNAPITVIEYGDYQ